MRKRAIVRATLVGAVVVIAAAAPLGRQWISAVAGQMSRLSAHCQDNNYPYHSARFDRLIYESYGGSVSAATHEFYEWMDKAYARSPETRRLTLASFLQHERHKLSLSTKESQRAKAEAELSAWVHRFVKSAIPKFSLDRGFEFRNVVRYGERQCFLQSVLAAGLLQRMDVEAGVVMVYRSTCGEESNNGHAVTLVKLSNGRDIILDASDPEPFARQMGLFARRSDYVYVNPVYAGQSPRILCYKTSTGSIRIPTSRLRTMDYDFIRSQFYYYRGERVPGGLLAANKTSSGLAAATRNLRTSVSLCPKNPLAVYMLGRAYLCQGDIDQARMQLERANGLYERFGWVPPGAIEYLDLARRPASASAKS